MFLVARSSIPSQEQWLYLLEALERNKPLAIGHARTNPARANYRRFWASIAAVLNNKENGCTKSWQQWSKYWKDKKSNIRKKGEMLDIIDLADDEKRVMTLLEQQQKNKRKKIDFQEIPIKIEVDVDNEDEFSRSGSLDRQENTIEIEVGTDSSHLNSRIDSRERLEIPIEIEVDADNHVNSKRESRERQVSLSNGDVSQFPSSPVPSNGSTHSSTRPRKRTEHRPGSHSPDEPTLRRRLLTPNPQVNLDTKSITERLLAIEEKRAEVDLINARTHQNIANSLMGLTDALAEFTSNLKPLTKAILNICKRNQDSDTDD